MKIRPETEARLEHWATWSCRQAEGALGYPRRSIEARLQDEGGIIVRNPLGSRPLEVDEVAEEMDSFITELAQWYRPYAEALKAEYLIYGSIEHKAALLNLSRSRFLMYRDSGKLWIDGRLHHTRFHG